MKPVPPGDDICPVPAPLDEDPPHDRFCDLVLTGGVASGVVYPWAIVEIARAYRFRSIGGTSVGAMAAALAAAAEYGRCTGFEYPFETLRRLPAALGEDLKEGRTRLLSLFQPAPHGRRLIRLWARLFKGMPDGKQGASTRPGWLEVARAYFVPIGLGTIVGALLTWALTVPADLHALLVAIFPSLVFALAAFVVAVCRDVRFGVIANNLGLCKGGTLEPQDPDDPRPGLTQWLHEGIQRSAGLKLSDPPLTFRDLWNAQPHAGVPRSPCDEASPPSRRSVNLQMITTNVTHGRPYRLPLADPTSRLFFRPGELRAYLPRTVLKALIAASRPYASASISDPKPGDLNKPRRYRELPGADMPIVVAARLSLSFPLLFSAVPLYAIDYETMPVSKRALRRCWFSDGGVSSNFPIHLFDAALPRWPTFGLWLDKRGPYQDQDLNDAPVWLPDKPNQGRADNWNRFDPATRLANQGDKPWALLYGFLKGLGIVAKDWHDRTSFRMPHVRNRVARLWLHDKEGGLHIGMPRAQILNMAHRYGTTAGRLFVERFRGDGNGETPAWREQRWIRLQLLVSGLRERLAGLSTAVAYESHCVPTREEINEAKCFPPLRDHGATGKLSSAQADSLSHILDELIRVEGLLQTAEPQAYKAKPEPELRLRAPL